MSKSSHHYPHFGLLASTGKIKGIARFRKFGYNQDIDTATVPEDVVSFGGVLAIPPTAYTLDVVSTSANDASGGTGINTILINGIDAEFNEISEVVTLNGLTPVTTTNEFLFVQNSFGTLAGSNQTNVGNINMTHTTGGAQLAQIPLGQGRTQQCFGVVPKGKTFLVDSVDATAVGKGTSASATVHFEYMVFGTNCWQLLLAVEIGTSNGPFNTKTGHSDYVALPEKSFFKAQVEFVSANDIGVTANIGGYFIDNREFSF